MPKTRGGYRGRGRRILLPLPGVVAAAWRDRRVSSDRAALALDQQPSTSTMPRAVCTVCGTEESLLWRSADAGQICNDCHRANLEEKEKDKQKPDEVKVKTESVEEREKEDERKEGEVTPAKATGKGTRKSTRSTRYKPKTPVSTAKPPIPRGRGRRSMFKRPPLKAPTAVATVVTSDSIFYKGNYMQVGDIVSMIDVEGGTYYAQIRGFMTDQYNEKSAVVTWLLPTKASPAPEERFDPATYIIGPEEDLPRKLDVMEFVMHAPSDYYKADNTPYPPTEQELNMCTGFIWTSLEAKDRI